MLGRVGAVRVSRGEDMTVIETRRRFLGRFWRARPEAPAPPPVAAVEAPLEAAPLPRTRTRHATALPKSVPSVRWAEPSPAAEPPPEEGAS
jgi:hypothetical protein